MRHYLVAIAAAFAVVTCGSALAATPGETKLSAADCVSAWNATPRAPAITALRGTHRARIQVVNAQRSRSGCIVSILRPGPKGIMVVGVRRGARPLTWRVPGAATMTGADVRTNAEISPGGVLALR